MNINKKIVESFDSVDSNFYTTSSILKSIESSITGKSKRGLVVALKYNVFFTSLSDEKVARIIKKEKSKLDIILYHKALNPFSKSDNLLDKLLKLDYPRLNEKARNCFSSVAFRDLVYSFEPCNGDLVSLFLDDNNLSRKYNTVLDYAKLLKANEAILLSIEKYLNNVDDGDCEILVGYFEKDIVPFIHKLISLS